MTSSSRLLALCTIVASGLTSLDFVGAVNVPIYTNKTESVKTNAVTVYNDARMTYYQTGLGACGVFSNNTNFVVALNSAQYGSGQYCFKTVSITANGVTVQARVLDECPGCSYAGLDLSPSLFQKFASLDVGVITGSWYFVATSTSKTSTPTPPPPPPPPPSTS